MANLPAGKPSGLNPDSDTSDYGPEFTLDEEELLNGLLSNIATEPRLAEACAEDDKVINPIQECHVLGRKLQSIWRNPKLKGEVRRGTYLFPPIMKPSNGRAHSSI
jgi:hypothetical protein